MRWTMALVVTFLAMTQAVAARPDKPNVIFILSDDLAQGDVGAYGQKLIQTPVLDRMAREGMRFTQAYCGTSVCAPSRTSLVIGKHMGHSPVRANREIKPEGQFPLPKGTYTVAHLFKSQGYATAAIGKWGMGMFDTTGSPLGVGFDHFYGYNCQRHAHSYFPAYLYDDDRRFELPGNNGKGVGKTYAQELIAADTVKWITANKDKPFFLYYAITLPHGRHEIDSQGIYADKDWTPLQKNYAAQVTRLDSDIGRILDTLETLGLDDKTLVIMSGDNGSSFPPHSEIGTLFDQAMGGKLRGFKRGMYEGALRQACIARWPGVIPAGKVCDDPWAFWDFLPTCAEILATKLPDGVTTDGVSILPLLEGGTAPKRDFFYWELHEGQMIQAARFGDIKAVRNGPSAAIEIYDLSKDVAETNDLAKDRPELVAQAEKIMNEAHVEDPNWPVQGKRSSDKSETKKSR